MAQRASEPARRARDDAAQPEAAPTIAMDAAVGAMLTRFAPPAALIDADGAVLGLHGEVARFLGTPRGALTGVLADLLRSGLREALREALRAARENGAPAVGGDETAGVLVEPLGGVEDGAMVYFLESAEAAAEGSAFGALRRELRETLEQAERSDDALQAANAAASQANEDLKRSNRALETSKEELGSMNDELGAINAELERKVAELEAANDDLANLVAATDVATLFLDTDLRIRRFSDSATRLADLVEADIGRPLATFTLAVEDPRLLDDARRVLETLETVETEVGSEAASYLRRIAPYRTGEGRIGGVVVTFSDVTALQSGARRMERQAQRQASVAELGELALGTEDFGALLDRAAAEVSERLDAPLVEIQSVVPEGGSLLLRAGSGWARGLVGRAVTPLGETGHAAYALGRAGPVYIESFAGETRFGPSELLRDHDADCGGCVAIGPAARPWGMLGAFRDRPCPFLPEEGAYLQSVANILWLAVSQDRARRAREEERRELRRLMDGLPLMIGVVDADLRFELCNRAFETLGWTPPELEGAEVEEAFGPEARAAAQAAFDDALAGRQASVEVTLTPPGGAPLVHSLHCAPRTEEGAVDGFFLAALDITERKRMEERNQVISAELDHRVKNVLALVVTIARMTSRRAESIEAFKETFEARIDSLARTHVALADASWDGTRLRDLLVSELAAFTERDDPRVTIEGPAIQLSMRATQSFALALHELTTNAVKYGALSGPEGRLSVSWRQDDENFTFFWNETPAGPVDPPRRDGFGARVLRAAVVDQLRGEADLSIDETGLSYRFRCPRASVEGRSS